MRESSSTLPNGSGYGSRRLQIRSPFEVYVPRQKRRACTDTHRSRRGVEAHVGPLLRENVRLEAGWKAALRGGPPSDLVQASPRGIRCLAIKVNRNPHFVSDPPRHPARNAHSLLEGRSRQGDEGQNVEGANARVYTLVLPQIDQIDHYVGQANRCFSH